jgi:hypothetical protein
VTRSILIAVLPMAPPEPTNPYNARTKAWYHFEAKYGRISQEVVNYMSLDVVADYVQRSWTSPHGTAGGATRQRQPTRT